MLKRAFIGIGLAVSAVMFVFGGGGGQAGSAPAGDAGRYQITMLNCFDSPEPPRDTSDMMMFFRDTLNADLKITWVPTTAYDDKFAVQVAAADLPMVVGVRSPRSALTVGAIRDGLFWPIDKYLNNDAYPNLKKSNPLLLERMKVDGKVYGLPWERYLSMSGMFWRQDWMDKLGLKTPTTIEEVFELCKAFTEGDPDGNGRADTTGLSMKGRNLGGFLSNVAIYYGGRGEWFWDEASGTVKNEVDHPAYQKSLDWFRNLYGQGYFVQNLVEINDEYIPFVQGRAGMIMVTSLTDAVIGQRDLAKIFPEGKVGFTQNMTTPEGKVAMPSHIGYAGALMFSRTSVKTEAELDRIMQFYNEVGKDENILTLRRGIKDKHYSITDGALTFSQDQKTAWANTDFPGADRMHPWLVYRTVPEKMSDSVEQAVDTSITSYKGELFLNLTNVLTSETSIKLGASLTTILQDARMRYVLGQDDLAAWQAAVARWRSAGGTQVGVEYTADYKANFSK